VNARARLVADDNAGWVLLLPAPRRDARVLCIELDGARYAEGAAFWHDDVTALNTQAQAEATFIAGSLTAESQIGWRSGMPLPYADGTFAVVACRLAGRGIGRDALRSLLPELARVLRPDGCVYLDVDNPGSYQSRGRGNGCRRGVLSKMLGQAGFTHRRHHAQIFEHGRLSEVIPSRGYRASRNAWRFRERLKELMLGRVTHRWFAPVHGVLASRAPLRGTAVSELPAMRASASHELAQFLVNPGKSFVAADAHGAQVPLITVVPTRADTISRRRTELAALEQLQAAHLPVAKLLPRIAREVRHGRHSVFEYEAFAGTTIDLPVPDLDACLERAGQVLRDFNRSSFETRVLRAEELDALVTRPLTVAATRYPQAAAAAQRLRAALEKTLAGAIVPLAWQHGDFKLENLVFGNADHAVRAIIDWELAAPRGLALVDLLYLLAYAEITRGADDDILPVMRRCMLPDEWPAGSRALLDAYVREFPLVIPFKNVCIGLFLAHHVANRFAYDARDFNSQGLMADLMLKLAERLESSAGPRP
jgi:SAM-dependent methyltransferase